MHRSALVALVCASTSLACGQGSKGFAEDAPANGAPPSSNGAPTPGDGQTLSGSVSDAGSVECSEETKKVYVVTQTKDLFRFDPAASTFTRIGTLACPTSATVYSMAVDRRGTAWVLFADGNIFHVSTKDAACATTAYASGQQGFTTFGMAFVSDAPGSSNETLYVVDDYARLGRIDAKTFTTTLVGTMSGGRAELSGTAEARLFTLFSEPPAVGEVNRTTGTLLAKKPLALDIFMGFAFAQWGGDFWLFTAGRSPSLPASVTQYSFATGAVQKTFTAELGTNSAIVGAGVSTCAPTTPPR